MSETFDPYRVWLGIPPESRPPTHYELLGISPNEQEKAVIEAAMHRQSGYVRNFQIGKHAQEATRILNEIATAKVCLLDAGKRAKYDAELSVNESAMAEPPHQAAPRALSQPVTPDIDLAQLVATAAPQSGDLLQRSVSALQPAARARVRRNLAPPFRGAAGSPPPRAGWKVMAGFAAGFALALVVAALSPRRSEPVRHNDEQPTVLTGGVYVETSAPAAPPVDLPAKDHVARKIVQTRTETLSIDNVARCEDDRFYVGLSGNCCGLAAVGYELDDVRRVVLEVQVTGALQKYDGNAFAGFVIDYHAPTGYTHRVALSIGPLNEQWRWPAPGRWGKRGSADRFIDLSQAFAFNEQDYLNRYGDLVEAKRRDPTFDAFAHWQFHGRADGRHAMFGSTEAHELKLEEWAPRDWDGKAWLSAVVTNSGPGAGFEGRLLEPAPPHTENSEQLPGEYRRLRGHSESVTSLDFLPNGWLISGSFDTTWAVWGSQHGMVMQRFATEVGNETVVRAVSAWPGGPRWAERGLLSALISNVNRINLVELPTGNVIRRFYAHTDAVRCVALSADKKRAISGGEDSKARFWDVDTGQQLWERDLPFWVYSVAISPDGKLIVLGTYSPKDGDPIRVFDTAGNQLRSIKAGQDGISGLSLSPDGKRCLSAQACTVKLWDLDTGAELAQFEPARGCSGKPVFSPDGRYAAWGGSDEFVSLWDVENRTMIAEFEHAPLGSPKHRRHADDSMPVAFSPDGKLLASGGDDGTIYLWNVASIVASETASETDDDVEHAVNTEYADFTPLELSQVATVVSTRGMFDTDVRLVFDDWSPKTFEGVPFKLVDPQGDRVPNVVVLYAPNGVTSTMPASVSVRCNVPAKAIHFLSGVSANSVRLNGARTISIIARLHYASGEIEDHPLRNGEHFADVAGPVDVANSKLAFMLGERQLRYFAIRPKRRDTIERIDLVKGPDPTAPIVMAITVEGL